jgi:hypothetical protein
VDLQNEKGAIFSLNKKYQIICNISGPRHIDFKAKSLVTGQDIPCAVARKES